MNGKRSGRALTAGAIVALVGLGIVAVGSWRFPDTGCPAAWAWPCSSSGRSGERPQETREPGPAGGAG
jgi:hypothetical protein